MIDGATCLRDVCSQLNFTNFAAVANAALGTTLSPTFDVFSDDVSFLLGCYAFEDVGVTAYHVRAHSRWQLQHLACIELAAEHSHTRNECVSQPDRQDDA